MFKASDIKDATVVEDLILQAITVNAHSPSLQKFILSADNPTVESIVEEATLREAVDAEQVSMKRKDFATFDTEINSISFVEDCTSCGRSHKSDMCPATSRTCNHCGQLNHFAYRCPYRRRIEHPNQQSSRDKRVCFNDITNAGRTPYENQGSPPSNRPRYNHNQDFNKHIQILNINGTRSITSDWK